MKNDTIKAKEILIDGAYTCVIIGKDICLTETLRGVAPLLNFYRKNYDFSSCCAADKVVGKAAAMLYVLLNINEIYAGVLSKEAAEVFKKYSVNFFADTIVDRIINRAGTGYCPMEEAVINITEPLDAVCAIEAKLKELTGASK